MMPNYQSILSSSDDDLKAIFGPDDDLYFLDGILFGEEHNNDEHNSPAPSHENESFMTATTAVHGGPGGAEVEEEGPEAKTGKGFEEGKEAVAGAGVFVPPPPHIPVECSLPSVPPWRTGGGSHHDEEVAFPSPSHTRRKEEEREGEGGKKAGMSWGGQMCGG